MFKTLSIFAHEDMAKANAARAIGFFIIVPIVVGVRNRDTLIIFVRACPRLEHLND